MMAKVLTSLWTDWMSELKVMTRKSKECATITTKASSSPSEASYRFVDKWKALRLVPLIPTASFCRDERDLAKPMFIIDYRRFLIYRSTGIQDRGLNIEKLTQY